MKASIFLINILLLTLMGCSRYTKYQTGKVYNTKNEGDYYRLEYSVSFSNNEITKIIHAHNSSIIYIGFIDGKINAFDIQTKKSIATYKYHTSAVLDMALSSNNTFISTGADKKLIKWKNGVSKPIKVVSIPTDYICALAKFPKQNIAFAVSKDGILYRIETEELKLQQVDTLKDKLWSIAIDSKGKFLAAGDNNGQVHIYFLAGNGKLKKADILHKHKYAVEALAFSRREGKLFLASAGRDQKINIWELKEESFTHKKTLLGHSDSILTIDFSIDGKLLISAGWDCSVYIWNLNDYSILDIVRAHRKTIQSICFLKTTDSRGYFFTSSLDGSIKMWKVKQHTKKI